MSQPFPFSAIVGQEEMKRAMILTAIDASIGGVLVFGDRGTGKSTAVRALAALLPQIRAIKGCPVNSVESAKMFVNVVDDDHGTPMPLKCSTLALLSIILKQPGN